MVMIKYVVGWGKGWMSKQSKAIYGSRSLDLTGKYIYMDAFTARKEAEKFAKQTNSNLVVYKLVRIK